MGLADRTPPSVEEYLAYRERLSNWGRWGPDDQLGTLNLITPEVRRAALTLPRGGRTISLAHPLDMQAGPFNAEPVQREIRLGPRLNTERLDVAFHSRACTHLDGLCHFYAEVDGEVRMYNGRPATDVRVDGARSNAIDGFAGGIVTRGVLYDVPRFRGVDFVPHGEPVHGWELSDVAAAEGVQPRAGDAVVIRGGRAPFLAAHPGFPEGYPPVADLHGGPPREAWPGCHPSILEFLHAHDAALLVWDVMDARGHGYPPLVADGMALPSSPVHEIAIPYMGMPLLDSAELEALAAACAELQRWEFLLVVAPLVIPGGTGSPVNPIAVL